MHEHKTHRLNFVSRLSGWLALCGNELCKFHLENYDCQQYQEQIVAAHLGVCAKNRRWLHLCRCILLHTHAKYTHDHDHPGLR